MENIIIVKNLTFKYANEYVLAMHRAIDDISFEIEPGSYVAVIGRNGSGKSTLAKNLNALLLPTEGTVLVASYDTRDENLVFDIRKKAGMVFQNPDNQLVSAVVEDDVAFGLENTGCVTENMRSRVDISLKAVGVYEHRKMAPHLLSGGQKQRVAIAGVLAMRPEIIIFDEPTAMLDPRGRAEVIEIIKALHDDGITVIHITHFMEECIEAERIIIMDAGRIALDGTPMEVFLKRKDIEELGLVLPVAVRLADKLREKGIEIPDNIIKEEQLVHYLSEIKKIIII